MQQPVVVYRVILQSECISPYVLVAQGELGVSPHRQVPAATLLWDVQRYRLKGVSWLARKSQGKVYSYDEMLPTPDYNTAKDPHVCIPVVWYTGL